jgi:hypothetical protein
MYARIYILSIEHQNFTFFLSPLLVEPHKKVPKDT